MEQFDREDTSRYNTSQPEQPAFERPQPVAPASQSEPKKKKNKAPLVLTVLLLLALLGAGVLGWMWYQQNGQVENLESDLSSARNNVSQLESAAKADAVAKDEIKSKFTTETSSSASEDLIKEAIAFSTAKVANRGYPANATDLEASIDKETAEFARVQVGSAAAGPGVDIVYFKKISDGWQLLGSDNSNIDRFSQTFGLPSGF
ncbi:hypothetical protein H7142_00485 [Candidatus Saccharibacteria bacterium]|nr:hypothetical protein [Candidatus Saccharibacteria bacterium]